MGIFWLLTLQGFPVETWTPEVYPAKIKQTALKLKGKKFL